jgi:hypothetical protein
MIQGVERWWWHAPKDVINGLTNIGAILEQLNEKEYGLKLFKDVISILTSIPSHFHTLDLLQ